MSLPKKYRLRYQKDFNLVKKEGRLFSRPKLGILVFQDDRQKDEPIKFGFLISRKVDRRAVYRNRIKRLISEAVFPFLPEMKKGAKVVFLPRAAVGQETLLSIKKEIEKLFREAKLLP